MTPIVSRRGHGSTLGQACDGSQCSHTPGGRKGPSILIWCPLVVPGGGIRLLVQLAYALARHPTLQLVRLAAPTSSLPSHFLGQGDSARLEVFALEKSGWLERGQIWLSHRSRGSSLWTAALHGLVRNWLVRQVSRQQNAALLQASRGCDLVYVFWPHRQVFPKLGKPVVCTFQDAIFFDFPEILGGPETKAEWYRAEEWLRGSARVVVSSNATKAALARHFGERHASVKIIHHAISPTLRPGTEPSSSELLARLPSQYIVCPANITSHKNHRTLLLAWSRFARRREYPLILYGGGTQMLNSQSPDWPAGWQGARLVGLVTQTGLLPGEDFYALGYVEDSDAAALLRQATALVMPTLAEGGGSFPVEEALDAGVPVLCSDIPVLREHLANRSARIGWFDPDSPESIVKALDSLLDDYEDFRQSALAGVSDPRPSWEDVAEQYVRVFRQVIAESGHASRH